MDNEDKWYPRGDDPMDEKTKIVIGVAVFAVVLGLVLGALTFRACQGSPPVTVVEIGIDAGPGEAEIAGRLDGSIQTDEQAIRDIEERNQRAIGQFDQQQEQEYAEVRRQGRRAVASWLSDFNGRLKTDAGTP